ncbi:MAG: hypothetical protein MN733_13240, partial [Nitrososphaera sp.]|nr:hypothetical protein [Nitrososphaera sp.]
MIVFQIEEMFPSSYKLSRISYTVPLIPSGVLNSQWSPTGKPVAPPLTSRVGSREMQSISGIVSPKSLRDFWGRTS